MSKIIMLQLHASCLAITLVLFHTSFATETLDFELKPAGIEQHVEYQGYGVICKFTYFAEGGTKEHWTLSLKRSKDRREILCIAERPDVQSYLMFESFSMELTNANVKNVKLYKDHEEQLPDKTFRIENNTKVSNTGDFKNEMSKLRVRGFIQAHNEL